MSASTTRFENLLEAVPDALVGMDQKGVIRFVNHQTESLFGYDRDQLIGEHIETLVPEPLWQVYAQHKEDYFADPRTRSSGLDLELSGQKQDGSEFPINISMSHIDTGDVLLVITAALDVSKQKEAVKNAQLTTALVESSEDAIIGCTLQGVITSWNPAAMRIYGYTNKEILGRSVDLLTPRDRAGEPADNLAKVGAGQQVEHIETVRVRKDGTPVPVSITIASIRDADGTIVGASAVHRDVTAQREAFEAAQRMAAIVENSDDAIISSTLDSIITSWNPAAEKVFGYSAEEIIGGRSELLTHEDDSWIVQDVLARIRAGEHVERIESRGRRKDGTVFPMSSTVSAICDADDAILGASAIIRDVTEQRHAARYARSLIEAALDPLVTISPEGKINDVNDATVQATGIAREQLIGTDFSQYFTDPDAAHEGYERAFAQGAVTDYPVTLRHRDGTLTDVLYNASVYRDEDGNVLGVFAAARDMTKQREAFEAAQRMAAIVEYSDDAIIGSTLEGIITSWNPGAERLYGHPRERIVRRSVDLLSPQERVGEIKGVLAKIRHGQPVDNFETVCTRKDGTTFPVKLTIAPIHNADGAVVGASAIARDVTEQRQALAAAEQMAAIIESSDDAIIGRTLEGIITSWNPAAERMFGYSGEEMVGKPIDLLTPQDREGEAETVLAKISAGQPVEHLETERVRKDGRVLPVSLTVSPVRDSEGIDGNAIVGASVIARDMTHQRQALAFARVAAAIEFSGEAIISSTLDGIITSWNPAAERMFGYSGKEIIGKSDMLLTPQDRAREVSDIMDTIRAGERVENFETQRIRKDGSVFPISLTSTPIRDADGTVIGASSTPRDITTQKEASEAAKHMAAIVEFSGEAIISQTLDGVVTSWNPAAETVFGYSSREIIGKPIELLSPEGRSGELSSILSRIQAGRPVEHHETLRVRKDGVVIRVSLTVSPIRGADGALTGLSSIARELTGRRPTSGPNRFRPWRLPPGRD